MTMMLSSSIFQQNKVDVFSGGIVNHAKLDAAPVSPAFRQYFEHSAFDTIPKSINRTLIIESNYAPAQYQRVFSSTKYLEDVNTNKMLCDISPGSPFCRSQSEGNTSRLESSNISLQADFEEFLVMGSGNFAEVYCVREKSSGKDYAVKKSKLPFKGQSDREFVLKEVNIMKRVCQLHSPYVLQLVRAWQEDGYLHVQLELAERGTLLGLMNSLSASGQIFPEDTIWRILYDVGSGLSHIHSCGVIHLDIKPANILISMDGTLMIGDFGNAIFSNSSKHLDGIEGDNRYFAPELLVYPCVVTTAADVFSFGLTLLELWNFVPGSDGLPGQGVEWQDVRNGRHKFREGLSNELAETITAMLRHSQDDRPSVDILLKGENVLRVSRLATDPIILLANLQTHITSHQFTTTYTTAEGIQDDVANVVRMVTPPISSEPIWSSRSRSRYQSSLASPSFHRPTSIRPSPLVTAATTNNFTGRAPSDLFGDDDAPFSPFLCNKNKRCNSQSSNKSPFTRRPSAPRATPLFIDAKKDLSTSPPLFKPISMELDDDNLNINIDQCSTNKTKNNNLPFVNEGNTFLPPPPPLLIHDFDVIPLANNNNNNNNDDSSNNENSHDTASSRTIFIETSCATNNNTTSTITTTTTTTTKTAPPLFSTPPPKCSLHSLPAVISTITTTSSTSTCISSKKGNVLHSEPKTTATIITAIDLEKNLLSMDSKNTTTTTTTTTILTRQKLKEKLKNQN